MGKKDSSAFLYERCSLSLSIINGLIVGRASLTHTQRDNSLRFFIAQLEKKFNKLLRKRRVRYRDRSLSRKNCGSSYWFYRLGECIKETNPRFHMKEVYYVKKRNSHTDEKRIFVWFSNAIKKKHTHTFFRLKERKYQSWRLREDCACYISWQPRLLPYGDIKIQFHILFCNIIPVWGQLCFGEQAQAAVVINAHRQIGAGISD